MPRLVTTKMTVLGPRPWGGTLTAELTDPSLDNAIAAGGEVFRIWEVWRGEGSEFFSVTLFDALNREAVPA